MTKKELARVVIQELYALPSLPPADNVNVLTMAKTHGKPTLKGLYRRAVRIQKRRELRT